ncbi:MAG: NUDIX hydrolase [Actinomycetales bacterium]|nr:NUDIX hydrolase [Actinomycetales bacterium]
MATNAAGTLPWRHTGNTLEVALVHRPRYDDWAWSKGKLEVDEPWPSAAVRETLEETGLQVRLGIPLPPTSYRVLDRDGLPDTKHVRYWAAEVTGGEGVLENEIDQVVWLDTLAANERLDYAHDREQLRALLRAEHNGTLRTWPLLIVRHALALPRGAWRRDDDVRPLSELGQAQSLTAATVLAAYGIRTLVTSPSTRCVDTLSPYAVQQGLELVLRPGLSEEGFMARGPKRVSRAVRRLMSAGEPAAMCSHGPVLPSMLEALLYRLAPSDEQAPGTEATLIEAADLGLDKGEILVAHVAGIAEHAKIVAVERVAPIPE